MVVREDAPCFTRGAVSARPPRYLQLYKVIKLSNRCPLMLCFVNMSAGLHSTSPFRKSTRLVPCVDDHWCHRAQLLGNIIYPGNYNQDTTLQAPFRFHADSTASSFQSVVTNLQIMSGAVVQTDAKCLPWILWCIHNIANTFPLTAYACCNGPGRDRDETESGRSAGGEYRGL